MIDDVDEDVEIGVVQIQDVDIDVGVAIGVDGGVDVDGYTGSQVDVTTPHLTDKSPSYPGARF